MRVEALEDNDDLMGTYRKGNNTISNLMLIHHKNNVVQVGGREHRVS